MTEQRPSVGRVVHYVSYGTPGGEFVSLCRAAIVTEVIGDAVGLAVLNPTGIFLHSVDAGGCKQDETDHRGGSWHWPERI